MHGRPGEVVETMSRRMVEMCCLQEVRWRGASARLIQGKDSHYNGKLGEEFEVKVGVHQGSVLSPILFAIVLKALSPGFSAELPWELLYDDDLVIMADSLDELSVKLERWKAELSAKGLKVNTKKTKTMISKPGAGPVQKTGKYQCSVCSKGIGSNSI